MPKKIIPHEHNPRVISEKSKAELRKFMEEFGDLGCIVHDENSGQIICGNQRVGIIGYDNLQIEIEHTFDEPTADGTVALGYVLFAGEKFAYRRVSWDEEKCRKALIVSNKAGGKFDESMLYEHFEEILADTGFEHDEIEAMIKAQEKANALPELELEPEKPIYPITPRMGEDYNCLVIVSNNDIDWNFLREIFDLSHNQSYKSGEVGLTRVIDFDKFISVWKQK